MMDKSAAPSDAAPENKPKKGNYLFLTILSATHGIFHFMTQSFSVMLPTIKEAFGINAVQIGLLITVKTIAGGLTSLPGGIISDYFRRHRGRLMMVCMFVFALGWLLIGVSPVYPLLMLGMVVVAVAGSVWHLPSLAELGSRFANSRGTAMALHGVGGSVGDILGPMITGVLLGYLSWRGIISVYSIIPFMMAFVVMWVFKSAGNERKSEDEVKTDAEMRDFRLQLRTVKEIMKKTHIWRINVVAGFRGMCFDIVTTFFPLFMKEDLGFSSTSIGFHVGLLWAIGIGVSPIMGFLSDRFGRKRVLVPALFYSCILLVALALFGKGIVFTILLALLGISIRSDYSILTATILDIVGDKVATTMLGILSFTRFMMAALAPIIAGALYQYVGMAATLYFIAGLFAISGIIFLTVDLNKSARSVTDSE
jgi:MFS family permease